MRQLLFLALAAAVSTSSAICDDDFQWQGQLAPGQLLNIRGVFGAVNAEGTSGNIASVTAHKTATRSDPNSANIQVVPFDGGVVICAVYPDGDPAHTNTCNPPGMNFTAVSNNDVEVEFTVKVPAGVRLTASTLRGDITARSLTAEVYATANIGSIDLSTSESAQADTRLGSITAVLGTVNWTGVRSFFSGKGDIDVQIPADANVSVHANTISGAIISDFPLTINSAPRGANFAYGKLGSDGRVLLVSTDIGNITLRRGSSVQ